MANHDLVDMISVSEKEWEKTVAGLNKNEFIAFVRNVIRGFDAGDKEAPPGVSQMVVHLRGLADLYERNLRDERIAIQNEALAIARFQRTADEILLDMKNKKRGN